MTAPLAHAPHSLPTDRLALTVEEAADALAISRAYLYRLIGLGQVRTFQLGRRRLVSVDALRKFIARRERQPSGISNAARDAARRALAARRDREAAAAAS